MKKIKLQRQKLLFVAVKRTELVYQCECLSRIYVEGKQKKQYTSRHLFFLGVVTLVLKQRLLFLEEISGRLLKMLTNSPWKEGL